MQGYQNWAYYHKACSTLESDQQFVYLWEKLSDKTKVCTMLLTLIIFMLVSILRSGNGLLSRRFGFLSEYAELRNLQCFFFQFVLALYVY